MANLQTVEQALVSINPAVFQELCDSFLVLHNKNYSVFSRTGSQTGKQKTVTGTPDTFLRLTDGNYIFVEHSTNVSEGLAKLEADIRKCLDTSKTGIEIGTISEIILCLNFNLKTNEVQSLSNLLEDTRITLSIYTLDSLSIELHLNHRDLVHQYLGIPLDTGQVVSIERFIDEYDNAAKGIATPLNNTFLHREEELVSLITLLDSGDFIVLTGSAGVGKTRLAIKGIQDYLSINLSFNSYCISYKHHSLLEDLYQYFDLNKDYVLFVDDANRIDSFNQIISFYKATRKGKLKIVITTRDYAFHQIWIRCREFSPKRFDVTKLSDEQVRDILTASPFDILNARYQNEIIRISDGNPRLAIMTALLAKAEQNIYALSDVSELFERYFSMFVIDNGEFAKELNIQCLGLIAFFHAIPYKNKEVTSQIIENFNIDYSHFIDAIDLLDKLELVELRYDYVKIPEQNLATFFFYKAFVKDDLLSFPTLLDVYFEKNANRFKDCVIPANNTFGPQNVMDKLQPFLQNHWHIIKNDEEKALKFLETFWYYLQSESLEFIYDVVTKLPINNSQTYNTGYKDNQFFHGKDKIIELLSEFWDSPFNLKDTIELSLEYVRKLPKHLPELIHKIKERFTFHEDDEQFDFERQTLLFKVLIDGLKTGDVLLTKIFFELSKTFLACKFNHTRGGRNRSIYLQYYSLPNTPSIQTFRKKIWEILDENFVESKNECFQLLVSYATVHPNMTKDIMEIDLPSVISIITKYLDNNLFEHCKYVHEQVSWFRENDIDDEAFDGLLKAFNCPEYEFYLKINWDSHEGKKSFEYDSLDEYQKLKEIGIRTSFVFKNQLDIDWFLKTLEFINSVDSDKWNYNRVIDLIVDENFNANFEIGVLLLKTIIQNNNSIRYIPQLILQNQLQTTLKADKIWDIIHLKEYNLKTSWEICFYDFLEDSLICDKYVRQCFDTFNRLNEPMLISFHRLHKFIAVDPDFLKNILQIIVSKNKNSVQIKVWNDLFTTHFSQLGSDIDLIKTAYLQQENLHQHFDYNGEGTLNILRKDKSFLIDYILNYYSKKSQSHSSIHGYILGFVWQIENIEDVLVDVFDLIIDKEIFYGILEHVCNSFFKNINGDSKAKAKRFLLDYCKNNCNDEKKMNLLVDVVRHTMREIYEEVILLFVSLNQDVEMFSHIWWRGNGGSGSGDDILADKEAADWRNILSIVNQSTIGLQLIPIKSYLSRKISGCLERGEIERQHHFLRANF